MTKNLKNLYKAALDANKHLEEKLTFLSKIAEMGKQTTKVLHELKNPVGVMKNTIEAIEDNKNLSAEETRKYLGLLRRSVNRIHDLIQGVEIFLKSGNEHLPQGERFAVHSTIKDIMTFIEPLFQNTRCKVILKTSGRDAFIAGRDGRLQQIMVNLVSNGKDALGESGGTVSISVFEGDQKIMIEVIDSGEGIEQERIDHLFDEFYTTKSANKGMGLGLSIVCSLVEEMEGEIEVSSDIGIGSKFTVTLPVLSWI